MSVSLKNKIDVYEIIYSVFDNTTCLSSSSHADECIRQGLRSNTDESKCSCDETPLFQL